MNLTRTEQYKTVGEQNDIRLSFSPVHLAWVFVYISADNYKPL